MTSTAILAVNAGSSSLKFALFGADQRLRRIAQGEVSGLGSAPRLRAQRGDGTPQEEILPDASTASDALQAVLGWLGTQCAEFHFVAIGHRVVHGGTRYHAAVVAGDAVLQELEALDPLAPQHQPFNLAGVRELRRRFPDALAVACFDTAFHAGWDDAATRMAIPRHFHDAGVRRYGFHGLSYEFLGGRLHAELPGAARAVLAHLGSGASLCALHDGRSIDCTMGFSVLDGLPMSTRSGAIDPGVIFHLHRQYGMSFDEIEHLLYYDSGLKGVSGIGGDMRALLARDDASARQAVALFTRHCVQEIGAMIAVLGGIDALVFSGGIGAHAAPVRAAICAQFAFFGIGLDAAANAANAGRISNAGSRVAVFAWPTDEELVIARHCAAALGNRTAN
jgi:acetate kinase